MLNLNIPLPRLIGPADVVGAPGALAVLNRLPATRVAVIATERADSALASSLAAASASSRPRATSSAVGPSLVVAAASRASSSASRARATSASSSASSRGV